MAVGTLVVLLAGCGSSQPGDNGLAPAAVNDKSTTQGGAAAAPGATGLPSVSDRKIVRTSTLVLAVDDVAAAVQKIDDIAVASHGFTSASTVSDDSQASDDEAATVTIRVPANSYAGVMSQLRGLAKRVRSENSQSSEVTEEYTDLQARLRNLTATENSYVELLDKAQSISDILAVQDKLSPVRGQIEEVQGRINVLDDITDLATITVQLQALSSAVEDKGWVTKAWDAAWDASGVAAVALGSIAIVGGVLLIWFVPIILLGLLGWRLLGRRIQNLISRLYKL